MGFIPVLRRCSGAQERLVNAVQDRLAEKGELPKFAACSGLNMQGNVLHLWSLEGRFRELTVHTRTGKYELRDRNNRPLTAGGVPVTAAQRAARYIRQHRTQLPDTPRIVLDDLLRRFK